MTAPRYSVQNVPVAPDGVRYWPRSKRYVLAAPLNALRLRDKLQRKQLRTAARSDVIVPRCRTKFGSLSSRTRSVEPSPAVRSVSRYCQTVQTITENSLLPVAFRSQLTNNAVTVFNPVFIIHTFYYHCNASRSGFVYRGH